MVSGKIEWRSPFGGVAETQDLELEVVRMVDVVVVVVAEGFIGK